jgi:hypothetical protein
MELTLNLAWLLLSALMLCGWLSLATRSGSARRMQFVGLVVLILMMFPVISVTDDLQAALNPAEVDSSLRRDHQVASPHSITPAVAELPMQVFAEISLRVLLTAPPRDLQAASIDNPALAPIQSRPPPIA